jgi:hypothetical protein
VLTPDLVDDVVTRAIEMSSKQKDALGLRQQALEVDLRRVETELGRLTEVIAAGEASPTILEATRARERRRADLEGRLVATPKHHEGERWYEITGQASYGALLAGVVGLVPPG